MPHELILSHEGDTTKLTLRPGLSYEALNKLFDHEVRRSKSTGRVNERQVSIFPHVITQHEPEETVLGFADHGTNSFMEGASAEYVIEVLKGSLGVTVSAEDTSVAQRTA